MLQSVLIILICSLIGYLLAKKNKNVVSNEVGEVGSIIVGLFIGIIIVIGMKILE